MAAETSSAQPSSRRFRSVCVFCASSHGANPAYRDAARRVGRLLARQGIELVYGGGCVGLMGTIADAALAAGGRAVGVMPVSLVEREIAHTGLTELHVVASMHERKARMADLSDAFMALPGGFGTLDELCEILTWAQLGIHRKPVGLLNVASYYDHFLALLDHQVREGLLQSRHRDYLTIDDDPERLFKKLQVAILPDEPKSRART
jgi:uncharacterized protein (TIGR00730 family)